MKIEIHPEEFRGAWQECLDYAKELGSGWRVPTKSELIYIYDNNSLDTNNSYWSSTTYANYTTYAWLMHFSSGCILYSRKKNRAYVCPIRDNKKQGINLKHFHAIDEEEHKKSVKKVRDYFLNYLANKKESSTNIRYWADCLAEADKKELTKVCFCGKPKEPDMKYCEYCLTLEEVTSATILNEKDKVKENASPTIKAVKHDKGKVRFDLIPARELEEVAKVFTFGAEKYSDWNWRGLDVQRIEASLLRHVYAHLVDEIKDEETHQSHLAHAVCNCLMIMWKLNNPKGGD